MMIESLFKFVKHTFSIYSRIYIIVSVKCVIYAAWMLYLTTMIPLIVWCLEEKHGRDGMTFVFLVLLLEVILSILKKWIDYLYTIGHENFKEKIYHMIFQKLTIIPFKYLEDTHFLDVIKRAQFCIEEECIDKILNRGINLFQNIIVVILTAMILITYNLLWFLILVLIAVGNVLLYNAFSKIDKKFIEENEVIDRKFVYYLDTLLESKFGKDFRFYKIGNMMIEKFAFFSRMIMVAQEKYERKAIGVNTLITLMKYFAMAISYIIVFQNTVTNSMNAAEFSFYITVGTSFLNMMTEAIKNMTRFSIFVHYTRPLTELLEMKTEKEIGDMLLVDKIHTLEFEHVSFAYPGENEMTLKDVSFRIQQGEKISIIGLNGAGKSTIVKLICRLYQPDEGIIRVNGISIMEYDFTSYIKQISALFQDYKLFACSLKENITGLKEEEAENLIKLLLMTGLYEKVERLPNKLESNYIKDYEEGGIELSGGEQQKVALARMVYKESSLNILDEPTSAMDTYAEKEFHTRFQELNGTNMVIYISHQMSSSLTCNKILVLEKGRVVDFDKPEKLIQKNGIYRELFLEQAKNYI